MKYLVLKNKGGNLKMENICSCRKKIENISVIRRMICILKILIFYAQFRSLEKNSQITKNAFLFIFHLIVGSNV